MSEDRRNALPAEPICAAVLIALFMTQAHTTTAANLRQNVCWTKSAPIFAIFSDSKNQENLQAALIQMPKISWKIYSRKANITPRRLSGGREVIPFYIFLQAGF